MLASNINFFTSYLASVMTCAANPIGESRANENFVFLTSHDPFSNRRLLHCLFYAVGANVIHVSFIRVYN